MILLIMIKVQKQVFLQAADIYANILKHKLVDESKLQIQHLIKDMAKTRQLLPAVDQASARNNFISGVRQQRHHSICDAPLICDTLEVCSCVGLCLNNAREAAKTKSAISNHYDWRRLEIWL